MLSYLYNVAHVTDIGTHNMYLLMDKCRLSAIKMNLFRFNMDKNLATQLLAQSLKSASPDRLSNVRTLVEYVPSVDISAYERLLLSTDPSKKALLETLAPHTGKFASYSSVIERYLASDCDDDETKREIYALYGDFRSATARANCISIFCPKHTTISISSSSNSISRAIPRDLAIFSPSITRRSPSVTKKRCRS